MHVSSLLSVLIVLGAAGVVAATGGCSSLPVTQVRPGVFAALGDDPQEAIEYATKYCRRDEHARIAVAMDNVEAVAKDANNGQRGLEVHAADGAFSMSGGPGLEHAVVFRFSCSN